jgi:hypothetical protein
VAIETRSYFSKKLSRETVLRGVVSKGAEAKERNFTPCSLALRLKYLSLPCLNVVHHLRRPLANNDETSGFHNWYFSNSCFRLGKVKNVRQTVSLSRLWAS